MKYSIDVTITYKDRTETQKIEGTDVNEVHQKVYKLSPKPPKEIAQYTTAELRKLIEKQSNLLKKSLIKPIEFSWKGLHTHFYKANHRPEMAAMPTPPEKIPYPIKPNKDAGKYRANLGVIDTLFASRKKEILEGYEQRRRDDNAIWEEKKKQIDAQNEKLQNEYLAEVKETKELFEWRLKNWEKERQRIFDEEEKLDKQYYLKDENATAKYCEVLLECSEYDGDFFDKEIFIKYFPENGLLFVEYNLPDKNNLTSVKEVKYIATTDEFREVFIPQSELNNRYEDILYQIIIRTIYELFSNDKAHAINQIVFNGKVKTIDKATGQKINPCIISLSVTKEIFSKLNLEEINPKECFKGLKGISAAKLHTITAVPPIMHIDREDKRFIESYNVVETLDNSTNIAAMNWEDFEHLIRELFEKEFSQNGGEVKVTQASRDGGVDAIAFDPDPIRGGKIVIQAKRYTNVVGVAAVRDLYGTVVNEGATKGILVTTSNYGADSYEFAKDKPITLLNGSNLLHLLEKHGHKAKIDIQEAKRILLENEKDNN